MLMDQKRGQRLADECMSPEQIVVAEAIKKTPVLDGPACSKPQRRPKTSSVRWESRPSFEKIEVTGERSKCCKPTVTMWPSAPPGHPPLP